MDFKIRVVENIGNWSEEIFGKAGTVLVVNNGEFFDLEGFLWNNDCEPFKNIEEINTLFNERDFWQTEFELVEE